MKPTIFNNKQHYKEYNKDCMNIPIRQINKLIDEYNNEINTLKTYDR